jgi:L-amino acid N-acyltransferase YncA
MGEFVEVYVWSDNMSKADAKRVCAWLNANIGTKTVTFEIDQYSHGGRKRWLVQKNVFEQSEDFETELDLKLMYR